MTKFSLLLLILFFVENCIAMLNYCLVVLCVYNYNNSLLDFIFNDLMALFK